ncbi:MAG: tetratricopeptide repeat protein [Chitinophagaceae bacterium]
MKLMYSIGISICLLSVTSTAISQHTQWHEDADATFKKAKELYTKEAYSLAYPLFKQLQLHGTEQSQLPVSIALESKYYSILCGLQLMDGTAAEAANAFIALEHHAHKVQLMSYHLAEYYFKQKQYQKANELYEKAKIDNLTNEQIATLKFHKAYGLFVEKKFSEAKPLFNAIRQITTDPNYIDANYYYGFICFGEKQYKEAIKCFELIDEQPSYQTIVPYYIAQIDYIQGNKHKALQYAEKQLAKGGQYYDLQLRQLVGHGYFEQKEFGKALPYLETYIAKTPKVRREDLYELAYCYYHNQQYSKAIIGFKELGGKDDSLAQNSMYLLADAYLKTDNKVNARNAFLFCAQNSSVAIQKEVSQFNYAKLSYELGYQDIAINEFKSFITQYPKSSYNKEAKELLVQLLANTNQYADALALINSLDKNSVTVQKILPRILYGRTVEYINDQQLSAAETLLNQLQQLPYTDYYKPLVAFWKAELSFRNNNIDSAIYFINIYRKANNNLGEANTINAAYILGHAQLIKENYKAAQQAFNEISPNNFSNAQSSVQQDAFVRLADCYFIQKQYNKALAMYEQVYNAGTTHADYALYQKAIIAGAGSRTNEKIALLQRLSRQFPQSNYIDLANIEIANTYMYAEQYDKAIPTLQYLQTNAKNKSLLPEAMFKLGICQFNLDRNQEALKTFENVLEKYTNSNEADAALDYVKNIFIQEQKAGEYAAFAQRYGKAIALNEADSLSYLAVNNYYNNKQFDKALLAIEQYLKEFPTGNYALQANYQAAFILQQQKQYQAAITYYQKVAEKAPNKYAEQALLQAARISYFELKDIVTAESYFVQLKQYASTNENKLEAMRGLLRCQYKQAKYSDALTNAQELLQQKNIATDDKMMANIVIAKTYQNNNQLPEAAMAYKQVINLGKSEYSAEARFRLAEILLAQGKLADAEKAAFDVINKAGSYEYWITKSYILLGEVYLQQKDFFNAEATLKSVVDNASISTLQTEAKAKLDIVLAEKEKNSKVTP